MECLYMLVLSLIYVFGASGESHSSESHALERPLTKMSMAEVKMALQKHVDGGLAEMRAEMTKDRELLQQTLDKLKDFERIFHTTPVAFLARGQRSLYVGPKQYYVFSHLVYSYGGGYDGYHGIFTAPRAGLYLFTVNFCAHNGKHVCAEFLVNGVSMSKTTNYSTIGETCNSLQLIVLLRDEDSVRLRSTYYSYTVSNYWRWNTFNGALIQPTY